MHRETVWPMDTRRRDEGRGLSAQRKVDSVQGSSAGVAISAPRSYLRWERPARWERCKWLTLKPCTYRSYRSYLFGVPVMRMCANVLGEGRAGGNGRNARDKYRVIY